MLPAHHWAHSFTIGADDIEAITNLLLEKETPLSSVDLATAIVRQREEARQRQRDRRYEQLKIYQPSESYETGDRIAFSLLDYRTATVVGLRAGKSHNAREFQVLTARFDSPDEPKREFVSAYPGEHPLNEAGPAPWDEDDAGEFSAEDIVNDPAVTIIAQVNAALEGNPDLARIAGVWFVRELMLDVDIGHLHLAEAVLDMHDGGPLTPDEILEQIGGLGDVPHALQAFSLNHAMNLDERFDEVGPAGQILWHLVSMLPKMVRQVPMILQYEPLDYNRTLLRNEMLQLEYDLDDEHSPVDSPPPPDEVSLTLIYPHRRVGTLPINSETRYIFPDARTPRIAITIVDAMDKQEYPCWIVHQFKYVFGLSALYQKHHLPVGAYVYLNRTDDPSRFEIEFDNYRPRTEWIPLVQSAAQGQLQFRTAQRAIGADYDEMVIVGVKSLPEVDRLGRDAQNKRMPLTALLRNLISELSAENPQRTVHAKVLYSTLNILRRCPPGPIFAALQENPEFTYAGDNYWMLSD